MKKAITLVLATAFILASLTVIAFMFWGETSWAYSKTVTEENAGTKKEETLQSETPTTENTQTVKKEVSPLVENNFNKEPLPEELTSEELKVESESEKETQKENLDTGEYLTLTGEYASFDESAYTIDEIALIGTILAKINENISNPDILEEDIPLCANFTFENYCKVASYFYVYYGNRLALNYTFDLVNAMTEDGYLKLRYNHIREFEAEMEQNKLKIDSILTNFTSGSKEHILRQIAEYLKNSIVYTDGCYNLSSALDGRSVCNGYALAFNAMANRAGITSDMCIGKSINGSNHAWNRITLSDGSCYFYDVTFYDSTEDAKYLHSETSFHGSYLINDYSSCFFNY